jgi:hypothetical protein
LKFGLWMTISRAISRSEQSGSVCDTWSLEDKLSGFPII